MSVVHDLVRDSIARFDADYDSQEFSRAMNRAINERDAAQRLIDTLQAVNARNNAHRDELQAWLEANPEEAQPKETT